MKSSTKIGFKLSSSGLKKSKFEFLNSTFYMRIKFHVPWIGHKLSSFGAVFKDSATPIAFKAGKKFLMKYGIGSVQRHWENVVVTSAEPPLYLFDLPLQ